MKPLARVVSILTCLALSVLVINKTRVSTSVPAKDFSVACIPVNDEEKMANLDRQLKGYYHIAHTSLENQGSRITSYRCYFRFPVNSIACVPPADSGSKDCPCYVNSDGDRCYFTNNKYNGLLKALERPAAGKESYGGKVVHDWQDVRDILLKIKQP